MTNEPAIQYAAVKLPEFWTDDPEVWFSRVESQFRTKSISADETQFDYIVSALPNDVASEVKGILLHPPITGKYISLKTALLSAFGKTQQQKDVELLTLNDLGDLRPSGLYRRIINLDPTIDTLRRALFLEKLPSDVRNILAGQDFANTEDLVTAADRIIDTKKWDSGNAMAIQFSKKPTRKEVGSNFEKQSAVCKYHARFGPRAWNCSGPPCPFAEIPRPTNPKSQGNGSAGH